MLYKQAKQFLTRAEEPCSACEVQRHYSLRRGFNSRRECGSAIGHSRLGRLSLLRVSLAQNNPGALRRLDLGDARVNPRNLGLLIAREDAWQGIRAVEAPSFVTAIP